MLLLPALKRVYIAVLQTQRTAQRDLHSVVAEDLWMDVLAGRNEDDAATPMDDFAVEVRC